MTLGEQPRAGEHCQAILRRRPGLRRPRRRLHRHLRAATRRPTRRAWSSPSIRPQGSAGAAACTYNDLIQRLNGDPVTDRRAVPAGLRNQFRKEKPRESVVLVVLREGREDTIRIEPPQ